MKTWRALVLINEEVAAAVLEHWIETGCAATVANLAKRLRVSEGKIRRMINDAHGAVPGTRYTTVAVPRFSKSYRAPMPDGKAGAWLPSDDSVRGEIQRLRGK